jgi:hypothetical protein
MHASSWGAETIQPLQMKINHLGFAQQQAARMAVAPIPAPGRIIQEMKKEDGIVGGGGPMDYMLHIRCGCYLLPLSPLYCHSLSHSG